MNKAKIAFTGAAFLGLVGCAGPEKHVSHNVQFPIRIIDAEPRKQEAKEHPQQDTRNNNQLQAIAPATRDWKPGILNIEFAKPFCQENILTLHRDGDSIEARENVDPKLCGEQMDYIENPDRYSFSLTEDGCFVGKKLDPEDNASKENGFINIATKKVAPGFCTYQKLANPDELTTNQEQDLDNRKKELLNNFLRDLRNDL